MITVNEDLKKLAELFPVPLYVVGGAVRDSILGRTPGDFDITAPLVPEAVVELLRNTEYKTIAESAKFGTVLIVFGKNKYEYTAFRKDSYDMSGAHMPTSVAFTEDITADALRRDFTMNAVYYDILKGEYIDPTGQGIADINRKVICTTREPKEVFTEDGLRILRMIRQAAECGFEIDKEVFNTAECLVNLLQEVSAFRKRDEFSKMLVADTKYGIEDAEVRAIKLLVDTAAVEYIAPEIEYGIRCKQRSDFHAYDVYGHILHTMKLCPPHLRLAALFHDIAKPQVKCASKGHAVAGAQIAVMRLKELGFAKDFVNYTAMLVGLHMYDLKCDTPEPELREFIQTNNKYIDDLLILKQADHLGSGRLTGDCPSAVRMRALRDKMLAEGVPMTVKDLKITGSDLISLGVPEEKRGVLMKSLLKAAAQGGDILNRESQRAFIVSYMGKN